MSFRLVPAVSRPRPRPRTLPRVPVASLYYCGSLSFTASGQDHFSATTSYTYSTNIATTLFTNPTGNAFQSLGPIPSGGTLVTNLPPNANGIIYAEVSAQSGQNYYVDTALTMARNTPYIQGWTYQPVDNTNTNHFVFKLNTAGIPVASGITPTFTFYPYFIAYSAVTLATPANITAVGTSSVNEFVQWTTSLATVNTGAEVTEAIITVNNTNPAVAQPLYLNNPTVGATGTIPLSSMTSTLLSSTYQYNYYFTSSKTTTESELGRVHHLRTERSKLAAVDFRIHQQLWRMYSYLQRTLNHFAALHTATIGNTDCGISRMDRDQRVKTCEDYRA